MDAMKLMRKGMLGIFLFAGLSSVMSQNNDEQRYQIGLSGAVNSNNAGEFELSFHYLLLPYVGIGGSIGVTKQYYCDYYPSGETTSSEGSYAYWSIDDESEKVLKAYLRPSILLRTPALLKLGRSGDYKICLQAEPGLMLTIPYDRATINYSWYPAGSNSRSEHIGYYPPAINQTRSFGSHKGDWCYWNLKSGIILIHEDLSFGLGYSISNFDIYAQRRNVVVESVSLKKFYPDKKLTHSFSISLGYTF